IIHTTHSAGYPWQVVQTSWAGEGFSLPDDGSPHVQIKMWATEELSRKIAELGGQDLDKLRASAEQRSFRPLPLRVTLTFGLANTVGQKESATVVGGVPV